MYMDAVDSTKIVVTYNHEIWRKRLNFKCTRIRSADPQMSYDLSEITFLWFRLIQLANHGSVLMCPPPDGERVPTVPSPCLEQAPLSFEPVPREPAELRLSQDVDFLTSVPRGIMVFEYRTLAI